ncbi:hypothetical protein ACHAPT_009900 [Fusarium lateritium]
MVSPPATPGRLVRAVILLIVKASQHKFFGRFWGKPTNPIKFFNICIKVRPDENLSEAYAMRFVASHTSIPVPKVYYAFTYQGASYTVMSRTSGEMVGRGWKERSDESKTRILDQLRQMITELRSVPPPEGAGVSAIDGGPIYDCHMPDPKYQGPCATVYEFHKALVDGLDFNANCDNIPGLPELVKFYRESGNELVLTHGDLTCRNILVRGDRVVGIVNWETAGWLPTYWEYSCAKFDSPWNPLWAGPVDQFLTPMPYEWEMDATRREYFAGF